MLDIEVVRAELSETTALGAAYLAGLATGFWADREELQTITAHSAIYVPGMEQTTRKQLLAGWHEAVRRTLM